MEPTMTFPVIPGGGAGRMGFVDLVLDAFAFLLRLGFVVARRESTLVRFEGGKVFINVYHGRSSFQVGLELGLLPSGEIYSLHELLTALAPTDIERARYQTTDPVVLARCLASIAETIARNCGVLLAGDRDAFEKLRSAVSPLRQAATLQAEFGAIIDRADRAWDSKDFSEAAANYEKGANALDETRMRRLEYLRKRKEKGPGV
jgi:hypothetical protein